MPTPGMETTETMMIARCSSHTVGHQLPYEVSEHEHPHSLARQNRKPRLPWHEMELHLYEIWLLTCHGGSKVGAAWGEQLHKQLACSCGRLLPMTPPPEAEQSMHGM